ncbi:MAG: TonB-dependent receptor [Lewinellaceae bacterium]|nr:TonB-dependent receptor [Lewinellaceae bacterium]
MKLKYYLHTFCFFMAGIVNAQSLVVTGKVIDSKDQQSLPGVTIVAKEAKNGVVTDLDGSYTIRINPNETLVFSYIGFATQEIIIDKTQTLNISLSEDMNKLEEVVVVGYGTQKRTLITNAISSVGSASFDDRPITSVGQALQGNAAGVTVVQSSGKPGGAIDIRIRGLNSIVSGVNPLFVIDGVQTYSADGISADDIVDIQILKDATATAIYGINGSAGVVLITTKRGKANTSILGFSTYAGFSKIVKNIEVLDLDQYKTLMDELSTSYVDQANSPKYAGINTNWSDEVFQTGQDKNYELSYTGGTKRFRTYTSLGYQDTKGIVKPSRFSRYSGRLNLDYDATSWLKVYANVNLIKTKFVNTSDNNNANRGGVILSALTTQPYLPIYADELVGGAEANGQLPGQFASNPIASLENPVSFASRQEDTDVNRILGNVGFEVTLLKNLVWKPAATIDKSSSEYEYFVDSYRSNYGRNNDNPDIATRGIGRYYTSGNLNLNLENTLEYVAGNYDNEWKFLLGSGVQHFKFDQDQLEGIGFPLELRKLDLSQMMDTTYARIIEREKNTVSYFARTTYNHKDTYILNGVFRASGSSQLAKGHKWGYFPGISAAWIISKEPFFKSKTISLLKLRTGWGQTGNISGIPEYASFGLAAYNYSNPGAFELINYTNNDLTWETTTDINIGVDVTMFDYRVKLSSDLFKRNTNNLLFRLKIEGKDYLYNAGEIENKGIEFSLNTHNIRREKLNWNTNFNISFLKNKVVEFGKNKYEAYGFQSVNLIEEGQPLGNFFGYAVSQINPETGYIEYYDVDGGGFLNAADRKIIGNAMPDFTFGFTNTLSYKGMSLDVLITGSQGNDIFNASRIDLEGMQDPKNQSVAVLHRWQKVGDITNIPRANDPNAVLASDRFVEDGSYVRLKSVTLAYQLQKSFLHINSLKIYATGQNLATLTKYSGFDPEVGSNNESTGVARGIDYGTYPQVKTYIAGIKIQF